jgi:GNAT superfamily N-acetyltransferase
MTILPCNTDDVETIQDMYHHARELQKQKGAVIWGMVSDEKVLEEIIDGRLWKIVINDSAACIWTITFSDAEIWEEKDDGSALYIHRIATHPNSRGGNLVANIVDWAKTYALKQNKYSLRLDTVGKNEGLIKYYTGCGFSFLGMKHIQLTDNLPSHYKYGKACLFELKI